MNVSQKHLAVWFVSHLVELLSQKAPVLCVGFAELLFVSDEQSQFADGPVQQLLGAPPHHLAEGLGLRNQHSPRLAHTVVGRKIISFYVRLRRNIKQVLDLNTTACRLHKVP